MRTKSNAALALLGLALAGAPEACAQELPSRERLQDARRESDVEAGIRFGYAGYQVGFGWTNAAFLELLAGLEQ